MRDYDRPNPAQYLGKGVRGAERHRPLDYKEKYRTKPPNAPFRTDRFDSVDLISRVQNRKMTLNNRLGFYPEPAFPELGRFNRARYDFKSGLPDTTERPAEQPGFDPEFLELYSYSPVVPPEKKISNPMPTADNPDPKGFLAAMGESRLKSLLNKPPSTEKELKFDEGKKIIEQSKNAMNPAQEQDQKKEQNRFRA